MPHPTSAVPQSPLPSPQAIRAYLEQSTRLKPEQLDRILQASLQSIASHLAAMTAALEQRDAQALGRSAHTLKGTLLQCGLNSWAAQAQAIHTAMKAESPQAPGDPAAQAALVESLRHGLAPLFDPTNQ